MSKVVVIKSQDIMKVAQAAAEAYIFNKLREAGIPMKGETTFDGVEHGVLDRRQKPGSGVVEFIWNEETPAIIESNQRLEVPS